MYGPVNNDGIWEQDTIMSFRRSTMN